SRRRHTRLQGDWSSDVCSSELKDSGQQLQTLRVDGGMARNAWFLQCQADFLGIPVQQAAHSESTALGAAFLAGLRLGVWPDLDSLRALSAGGRQFEPHLPQDQRTRRLAD